MEKEKIKQAAEMIIKAEYPVVFDRSRYFSRKWGSNFSREIRSLEEV